MKPVWFIVFRLHKRRKSRLSVQGFESFQPVDQLPQTPVIVPVGIECATLQFHVVLILNFFMSGYDAFDLRANDQVGEILIQRVVIFTA